MGGFDTRAVLRGFAAIVSMVAVVWLALWYLIPAPPPAITIAAGLKGGSFEYVARRYQERPLFTYAPRLYEWFLHAYLNRLYRRLRAVETEMDSELTGAQVEILQADLKDINRAAHILPMRHSDTFIDLITHIRVTRAELVSRLAACRK